MTEKKTLAGIKADMFVRRWAWTALPRGGFGDGWDCQISDLTIETEENLYLAPTTGAWGGTRGAAIRAAYARALVYFPALPALYDEHGIPYRIVGGAT